MGFEYARTVTTTAAPEAVWSLWSDLSTWPDWDPAVDSVDIEGGLVEGARGTMTLGGGIQAPVTLEVVEAGHRYLDRLDLGELTIRIDHVVEPTDQGARITVSTVIDGPGADEVGPMVTHDAPVALARLVDRAEGS